MNVPCADRNDTRFHRLLLIKFLIIIADNGSKGSLFFKPVNFKKREMTGAMVPGDKNAHIMKLKGVIPILNNIAKEKTKMDNCKTGKLEEVFRRFKGQPIEILTEDGVRYCGVDIETEDDSVEIIDKDGRIILIPFGHITAVVEPQMKLDRFCGDDDCDCKKNHGN